MAALHRKHFVLDTGCLFLCPMQLEISSLGPDADEMGCTVGAANQLLKPTYDQGSTTKKTEGLGWAAVDEYLSDEVASGSEDGKKIRAAEQRALRKKKNARSAKSGQKLSILSVTFIRFLCPFFIFFSVQEVVLYHCRPIPPIQ